MNFQEPTQNEAMTVCGVCYEILRLLGHGKGVKRILIWKSQKKGTGRET